VVFFSSLLSPGCVPWTARRSDPARHQWTVLSGGGTHFLVSLGEGLGHTMEPSEAQEPVRGVPPVRLVRTGFKY
jgi:hypothetical protein